MRTVAVTVVLTADGDVVNDANFGLCNLFGVSLVDKSFVCPSDTARVGIVRVIGMDLGEAQRNDAILGDIIRAKLAGEPRPSWEHVSWRSEEWKLWWNDYDVLVLIDGVLHRKWFGDCANDVSFLPAIPTALQSDLLSLIHDGLGGGHFGRRKTLARITNKYYWPRRRRAVIEYCRECNKRKGPGHRRHGELQT